MVIKSQLMFSELTGKVYYGSINTATGRAHGNKNDVTNSFMYCVEQKFPAGFSHDITVNGEHKFTIYNVEAGKVAYTFEESINPDDIDMGVYNQLATTLGLTYFDNHGCCDACSKDVVSENYPCTCKKLERRQLIAMNLAKRETVGK